MLGMCGKKMALVCHIEERGEQGRRQSEKGDDERRLAITGSGSNASRSESVTKAVYCQARLHEGLRRAPDGDTTGEWPTLYTHCAANLVE